MKLNKTQLQRVVRKIINEQVGSRLPPRLPGRTGIDTSSVMYKSEHDLPKGQLDRRVFISSNRTPDELYEEYGPSRKDVLDHFQQFAPGKTVGISLNAWMKQPEHGRYIAYLTINPGSAEAVESFLYAWDASEGGNGDGVPEHVDEILSTPLNS